MTRRWGAMGWPVTAPAAHGRWDGPVTAPAAQRDDSDGPVNGPT
ncbi:MAG: hypothetical protein N2378_05670 [Chloroflexaceae bacterium]|nr:hypothetical protein [Chloroflexaceae bacterium]